MYFLFSVNEKQQQQQQQQQKNEMVVHKKIKQKGYIAWCPLL